MESFLAGVPSGSELPYPPPASYPSPPSPPNSETPSDLLLLSPAKVALAAALLLINSVISFKLRLGTEVQLLVAGFRCVVQLSFLGYILVPIFSYGEPWMVLGYVAFMVLVSAFEAMGRPRFTYR